MTKYIKKWLNMNDCDCKTCADYYLNPEYKRLEK